MRKFILMSILYLSAILVLGFRSGEKSIEHAKEKVTVSAAEDSRVQPGKIVIKFKDGRDFGPELSKTGMTAFDAVLSQYGITRLEQVMKRQPDSHLLRNSSVAVESIYYGYFSENQSPVALAREVSKNPEVEYAEPLYYYRLFATPNDPSFNQQSYFDVAQMEQAWNIAKGEQGDVIIAIIDAGTDISHPDLEGNVWINSDETPGNGVDDDSNGFIDDVNGWDFVDGDNDVTPPGNLHHGTQTAGIAGAVTNNNAGVAGASWNARVMPVRVLDSDGTGLPQDAIEGIVYAAENGADVINLSLGRGGEPSNFEQDMINAAVDLGAAIVAAAGNENSRAPHYPSSYDNVLSVTASDNMDSRAGFSNYGTEIDVVAPGVNIFTTLNNGQFGALPFGQSSGTSFSSPIAAGIVALVKTQHPEWSGIQAAEQVRATADDIDAVNPGFEGLLGNGRVNALRALTETVPAIRISDLTFTDGNGDGAIQKGETVQLQITFINYLAPALNIDLTLTTTSSFVTLTGNQASISSLGTLEQSSPITFSFDVKTIAPSGSRLNFFLEIDSGETQREEKFALLVEAEFVTTAISNVDVSLTDFGRIGFADPFNQLGGIGFKFNNGPNLLFEGAIISGTGPDRISNAARGVIPVQGGTHILNQDFAKIEGGDLQLITPGVLSDQETLAIFKDTATSPSMNIRVTQESFAMQSAPNNDFVILRYTIENQGETDLNDFHFGLFLDWDLGATNEDVFNNFANFDASRNLGYVFFQSTYVGVSLLTNGPVFYRAINNQTINDSDGGGDDGFTDAEKWSVMSNGTTFQSAGPADVSHVIGSGSFVIESGDFIQIDFAMTAATGANAFQDLQANADDAKAFWAARIATSVGDPGEEIPTTFALQQNYPNPFNPSTTIQYEIAETGQVELSIYNLLGQKIRALVNENQTPGVYRIQWDGKNDVGQQMASGVYLLRLIAGDFKQAQKMMLLK